MLSEKASIMNEMSTAVTMGDSVVTGSSVAQVVKTTSSACISNPAETGFVNDKIKSAVSNTMGKVKPLLRSPEVLAKIVEMRSNNVKLSDVVTEASCLIDNIEQAGTDSGLHISMLPNFIGRLDKQISKGESLVGVGQTMHQMTTTHPGRDPVTDQLAFDFSTCRQKFSEVKTKSKQFLPGSNIPTSLLIQMLSLQPEASPSKRLREHLDRKMELGQTATSLHEVNTVMHAKESTVDLRENPLTGLAELTSSGPLGQREDGRKVRNEEEHEKDQEDVRNLFNDTQTNLFNDESGSMNSFFVLI